MTKARLTKIVFTLPFLAAAVHPAYAYDLPDFGSCLNPQGSVVASYASGTHGVVGDNTQYQGSDAVYQSSPTGVTQCLCADTGEGIQTNWLQTSGMSQSDISILENQGFIYVATGAKWGLSDIAYLAQNVNYSCGSAVPTPSCTETPTPTPTGTLTPTPTTTPGPSATPTPGPTATPTPGPTASATPTPSQTRVAGLAYTGNMLLIYGLVFSGAVSLILGLLLKRFNK